MRERAVATGPGWEGFYDVSDQGRVLSRARRISVVTPSGSTILRQVPSRLLRAARSANGYLTVRLCDGGTAQTRSVHGLVAEAFLGPRPANQVVLHGPGGKRDNRLSNLRYGSLAENNGPDRRRDGSALLGSTNPNSKLREADIQLIRANPQGLSQRQLSRLFAVSIWTIQQIRARKLWRHVA